MALLAQSTYTIKKIPKENYRFDLSAETIVVPADSSGVVTDYSGAKVDLRLSYDGKEIYPNYDDTLEGRNLLTRHNEQKNTWVAVDGRIASVSFHDTSDYIEVKPKSHYAFFKIASILVEEGIGGYWRYAWYDKDKNYISRRPEVVFHNFIWETPINAYFVRLSYPTDSQPKFEEDLGTQITSSLITKNCDASVTNGILSITNLTADAGYVDVTVDYGVWKQTKRVTIAKSKQGSDGVGISSIVEYYAVSASSTVAPSVWIETIPTLTAVNKYLWNYEKITYTNASFLNTLKKVIGVYGDKGIGGSDGRGITSITNYYLATDASSGVTTGTSGWTIGVQQITVSLKYLWNYEVVKYTSGSDTVTTPTVIGTFGAKGDDGADGKSIILVDVEYGVSASASVLPTVWTTTAPTLTGTQQLWTRTKTTYSVGSATYSTPANITPKTGADGAIGTGIEGITEEYYLSSSKTAQTGGSWLTNPPTWVNGWYIWTRSKIVYKNPTSTVYTTAIVSSEWEAVNELAIVTQDKIDTEKQRINDIFNDNIADPSEKQYLANLWQEIFAESPRIWSQADTYAISKTTYEQKYTALKNILDPVLANLTINTNVSGASIRTAFSQYYDARTLLQNDITNKINQNAQTAADAADAAAQIAAAAQAKANQAAAVTDKFGTTANGGLISTVMILLRELNSMQETAGISGRQSDGFLPSSWSGGTYQEAVNFGIYYKAYLSGTIPLPNLKMANIVHLHKGITKNGDLIIDESGKIFTIDRILGIPRFEINTQTMPSLQSLLAGLVIPGPTVSNTGTMVSDGDSHTFSNKLTITENGSDITIKTSFRINWTGINGTGDGMVRAELTMRDIDNPRSPNIIVDGISDLISQDATGSQNCIVNATFKGMPKGRYELKFSVTAIGVYSLAYGNIQDITMSSVFNPDLRQFQFGLDGMRAFYKANHWDFNELTGFDLRGQTNMPGVLLSTTVTTAGAFLNFWGAKKHASLLASKVSTGTYDVYHSIGHGTYNISANAYGNRTISIVSKSADRCRVQIYNGTTLIDGQFDITLTGNNY